MEISAAVVSSFDHPPRYESYDLPAPGTEDEVVLDVLAVGLHPRVRTGASGRHYTSTGKLPMVPGVDGVGRLPDGRLVYFVADDELTGLSTLLLDEAERRRMRRGREARQLDLGYPQSPLNGPGDLSGYRAPDAPLTGAGEQSVRLFQLLAGPQWTLIGYEVSGALEPRAGVRIHTTGVRGDIVDRAGHLRDAYDLSPGDWVLIRPDGYVALVTADRTTVESYLDQAGLHRPQS
ncbi:hypothetical protein [Nonomuraea sp. NPDC049141]|uniref:aromatic-ring hydroxylase C-terminal domain-containing protein n=1 Tax=unclassified Nonomuraea TaxID=2593643 RepID=UPI0033F46AE1